MKIKKSLLCALAFALTFATALTACNGGEKIDGAVDHGDGWVLMENGTFIVDCEGDMPVAETDEFDKSVWLQAKPKIIDVVIKDGVTNVATTAFANCEYLESVSIPSSVTAIGVNAFSDSMRLQSVTIPGSVKTIGASAFSCCRGLKTLVIEDGVEVIENAGFAACDSVTSVTLPATLKSVGAVGLGFTVLESLVLPDGLESLGDNALYNCRSLTEINVPASVKSLGVNVFPASIKTLRYGGTEEEWKALTEGVELGFSDAQILFGR